MSDQWGKGPNMMNQTDAFRLLGEKNSEIERLSAEGVIMREALERLAVGISPWMIDDKIPKGAWQIMSAFAQETLAACDDYT